MELILISTPVPWLVTDSDNTNSYASQNRAFRIML